MNIESGKRQARDPLFLTYLERSLKRKREELEDWSQESNVDPDHPMVYRMMACKQREIMVLQDCILRVKDGCYHLK